MKKTTALLLTVFIASQFSQPVFAFSAKKFASDHALGAALILGGITEFKSMDKKTKAICQTLSTALLLYGAAEKLPDHTRKFRSANDFSLVDGLYSLSAAGFITMSLIKCGMKMREQPAVAHVSTQL